MDPNYTRGLHSIDRPGRVQGYNLHGLCEGLAVSAYYPWFLEVLAPGLIAVGTVATAGGDGLRWWR